MTLKQVGPLAQEVVEGVRVAGPTPGPKPNFGVELDDLAKGRGGWPPEAMVYALEAVGSSDAPDNRFVLLRGGVPDGIRKDGYPKFSRKVRELKAIVSLEDYRAAIAKATGR